MRANGERRLVLKALLQRAITPSSAGTRRSETTTAGSP